MASRFRGTAADGDYYLWPIGGWPRFHAVLVMSHIPATLHAFLLPPAMRQCVAGRSQVPSAQWLNHSPMATPLLVLRSQLVLTPLLWPGAGKV